MTKQKVAPKSLILVAFFLIFVFTSHGQEGGSIDKFSLNPKVSWYNMFGDKAGFAAGGEFSLLSREMIYSLDYYGFEEFTIWSPIPPEGFNQLGLMIGKFKGDRFRHIYQAGLAAFWGHRTIDNGMQVVSDEFFTAGVVARYGIEFILSPYLSVGADMQVNLNPKKSVYMPMFNIGIGRLRHE